MIEGPEVANSTSPQPRSETQQGRHGESPFMGHILGVIKSLSQHWCRAHRESRSTDFYKTPSESTVCSSFSLSVKALARLQNLLQMWE